jgi:predicted CoA-binding protein
MRHLTREDALVSRLLYRARTVAVVGASPRPERHSHVVATHLKKAGYDVVPVRAAAAQRPAAADAPCSMKRRWSAAGRPHGGA